MAHPCGTHFVDTQAHVGLAVVGRDVFETSGIQHFGTRHHDVAAHGQVIFGKSGVEYDHRDAPLVFFLWIEVHAVVGVG